MQYCLIKHQGSSLKVIFPYCKFPLSESHCLVLSDMGHKHVCSLAGLDKSLNLLAPVAPFTGSARMRNVGLACAQCGVGE